MILPRLRRSVLLLVATICIECGLVGYIGVWRESFWQAVNTHNYKMFSLYLVYFSLAALAACLVSGYGQYLGNYVSLILRTRMTRKALKQVHKVENYQQRIQEDCFLYNQLKISLLSGGIRNIVVLITYSSILVYQLHWTYLTIPILYAIIGTGLAAHIARPLINLNYVNQNLEAGFRQVLSKLNYSKVYRNNYNMFKTTKYLSYFQSFYSQITVIVPYLILAPLYFGLKISFGVLMQCSASINTIIDCLSYGIQSFNDFNKWLSCRKRLREMRVI